LKTARLDSTGLATFAISTLSTGTHTVSAEYSGDGNFTGSTSGTLIQIVNQAPTATALSTSPDPSVFGELVAFTATVTVLSPAIGTPTGTVTFRDGSTVLGTSALDASGHATLATTALAAGSHAVSSSYGGDANFSPATSVPVTQMVNQAATTVTVTSSVNPSILGLPVTFTAVVRAVAPGNGTPTGTVAFREGTTTLGTASLSSAGIAIFTTGNLARGNHAIVAVYSGDTNFIAGTSQPVSQTIRSTPNEAFVTALYRDVLGRLPDAAGFSFWVQQLQAGAARATLAMAFEVSAEYRGLEVDQFYGTFLNRPADVGGRALWVNALLSGVSEADVVVAFVTSAEYTANHRDNASYVNGLYQDVLGHPADPAGAAFWQGQLQRGLQSRGQVALSLLSSTEAYFQAIDSYYSAFLGRPADSAGRQGFFTALQNGQFTPTGIATVFLASDEFLARAIILAGG
jgi:hypothetical protein